MATEFWLNNIPIKSPPPEHFEIEKYKLTKSGRLLSGRMVMDVIAPKKKFKFTYPVISHKEFEKITNIIDSYEAFHELKYTENNVIKIAIVYAGAIKARKFRTGSIWYWTNASFDLIEQ